MSQLLPMPPQTRHVSRHGWAEARDPVPRHLCPVQPQPHGGTRGAVPLLRLGQEVSRLFYGILNSTKLLVSLKYFRFCIPFGKEILMYAYFPGYGIQMSSIDPEFLITETVLRSKGWMDAKLKMVIEEKLPKENSQCQQNEHNSASHLKSIHENHENCILDAFSQNWSKRNKSCSPFVLENYRAM